MFERLTNKNRECYLGIFYFSLGGFLFGVTEGLIRSLFFFMPWQEILKGVILYLVMGIVAGCFLGLIISIIRKFFWPQWIKIPQLYISISCFSLFSFVSFIFCYVLGTRYGIGLISIKGKVFILFLLFAFLLGFLAYQYFKRISDYTVLNIGFITLIASLSSFLMSFMCVHEKYMIAEYISNGYKILLFFGGMIVFVILFFIVFNVLKAVYEKQGDKSLKTLAVAFAIIFVIFYFGATNVLKIYKTSLSGSRPNILFILMDTLRADHLGIYGYKNNTSPFIDGFFGKGAVFLHAIAQDSWTYPSTASILTSQYPSVHGAVVQKDVEGEEDDVYNVIDKNLVTLAEALEDNGYLTAAFVTSQHVTPAGNFDQGFDYYQFYGNFFSTTEAIISKILRRIIFPKKTDSFYATVEDVNKDVFYWLDRARDNNFFIYIHYFDTHAPYIPPTSYVKESSKPCSCDYHKFVKNKIDENIIISKEDEDLKNLRECYDGEVRYFDYGFKQLIDRLDKEGMLDNLVVVLTSDHGEEFLEHTEYGHGDDLYHEVIHVPILFYYPEKISPDTIVDNYIESIDIAPTILDLVGINPDQFGFCGTSLFPFFKGQRVDKEFNFSEHWGTVWSIQNKEWKLINYSSDYKTWKGKGKSWELFNIYDDFREENNLFEQEPDIANQLVTRLEKFKKYLKENHKKTKTTYLDQGTKEKLKALGYLN